MTTVEQDNDYLTAKRLLEIDKGEEAIAVIQDKASFRRYLSQLARVEQKRFATRSVDENENQLKIIRFN